MRDVSTFRLYLLRATYLLIGVGLGMQIWPAILDAPADLAPARAVVRALLGALSLLALLGIRYPLQMLPLLLFELTWKIIWLLAFGLPLWLANKLDPASEETLYANLLGLVICPLAIPWDYVLTHYVRKSGDRWRGKPAAVPERQEAAVG